MEEDVALAAASRNTGRCASFGGGLADAEVVGLARVGSGALGEAVDRWDEGAREREQAQGDELRPDAGGGTAPGGRDRSAVAPGDAADTAEDACLGAEVRGDELPAELRRREERLAAIRAAKARLNGRRTAVQAGVWRTGRRRATSRTRKASSDAQVAVDASKLVVAGSDGARVTMPVLLDAVKETFDAQPERVLADAGYCNERDLKDLEERGVDGYVAPGREGKQARSGEASGDGSHGGEAGDAGGPGGVCGAQVGRRLPMAGSSTCWASGASASWTGEGAGRVGLGVWR